MHGSYRLSLILRSSGLLVLLIVITACGSSQSSYERERFTMQQQVRALESQLAAANDQIARLTERENWSSQQRSSESEQCRAERSSLQDRLDQCEVERVSLKASEKGLLIQRIQDCRSDNSKEYQRGVTDGKLGVLNAVEILGVPEIEEGWITDSYFYRFQVRVSGRSFYSMRVRTHGEETPFGSVLAAINDLKVVVLKR